MRSKKRMMPAAALVCFAILVVVVGEKLWTKPAPTQDHGHEREQTIVVLPLRAAEAACAVRAVEAKFGKTSGVSIQIDEQTNTVFMHGNAPAMRDLSFRLEAFDYDMPQNGVNVCEFRNWRSALFFETLLRAATWFPPLSEDDLLDITVYRSTNIVIFRARRSSEAFIRRMAKTLHVSD